MINGVGMKSTVDEAKSVFQIVDLRCLLADAFACLKQSWRRGAQIVNQTMEKNISVQDARQRETVAEHTRDHTLCWEMVASTSWFETIYPLPA